METRGPALTQRAIAAHQAVKAVVVRPVVAPRVKVSTTSSEIKDVYDHREMPSLDIITRRIMDSMQQAIAEAADKEDQKKIDEAQRESQAAAEAQAAAQEEAAREEEQQQVQQAEEVQQEKLEALQPGTADQTQPGTTAQPGQAVQSDSTDSQVLGGAQVAQPDQVGGVAPQAVPGQSPAPAVPQGNGAPQGRVNVDVTNAAGKAVAIEQKTERVPGTGAPASPVNSGANRTEQALRNLASDVPVPQLRTPGNAQVVVQQAVTAIKSAPRQDLSKIHTFSSVTPSSAPPKTN